MNTPFQPLALAILVRVCEDRHAAHSDYLSNQFPIPRLITCPLRPVIWKNTCTDHVLFNMCSKYIRPSLRHLVI